MPEPNLTQLFEQKRTFFDEGRTRSFEFRREQLLKLKEAIRKNERAVLDALYADLHKPELEAYAFEIGVLYSEIDYAVKHLKRWMRPVKVPTAMTSQPASSRIYSEPLGVVLIIGPWNYPFNLVFSPLVGAITAGCCAMILPSDQAMHTSDIAARLVAETFPDRYISVVQGPGAELGPKLIEGMRFDHIFFTGSPAVGSLIAGMAAKSLTPVTLELGGKSPAIVTEDANLEVAAKKLVWGKFANAGQTCVAPDYVLVHQSIKDRLVERMVFYIKKFYGDNPKDSLSFTRIINAKRFDVLSGYLSEGRIAAGGETDRDSLYIAPTILLDVAPDSACLRQEIFGPILPVIPYSEKSQVFGMIRQNRYPLALYLFTESRKTEEEFLHAVEFGGGCVNNTLYHLSGQGLPFGGVGPSGVGRYHGKYSFDTFTHKKSILHSRTFFDPGVVYPPYSQKRLDLIKKFLK